jgi:hypothetical protein
VIQATGTWDGAAAGERLFPSDEATIIVLADRGGDVRYLLDEIQTMLFGR